MRKIPGVSIHWPAMSKNSIDQYKGKSIVDHFDRMHKARKYLAIGYHYVINRDANGNWQTYGGRPDSWTGAHSGTNYGNQFLGINVCLGMDEKELSLGAFEQLAKLISTLSETYKFPINNHSIKPHRYFLATECPGDLICRSIPKLISESNNLRYPQKQPEDKGPIPRNEEQISDIKINLQGTELKGVRINSQAYIWVGDLINSNAQITNVGYEKQTDTVIIK